MSTKTSIKRISLVAVAALGLGMVSTVAANAGAVAAWTVSNNNVTSINLTSATSAPTTNSAVYVNVGGVFTTVAAGADDTHGTFTTLRAALTSYPSSGYVTASGSTNVEGANAGTKTSLTGGTTTTSATNITGGVSGSLFIKQTTDGTGITGATVTSSATAGVGSFTFTPTVAGTYVLTVWNDANNDGVINVAEAQQNVSLAVVAPAAAASLSQSYSTVYAVAGNGTTAADSTSDATGITAAKAIVNANAGALTISAKNTSNAAITTVTVSASVSGVGLIKVGTLTDDAPSANVCSSGGVRSVAATAADAVNTLYVCADGNAGTGTVTVTITDTVSGAVATFTKSITFYGAVASYKAKAVKVVTGASAPTNGAATSAAVEVIAYDAAGIVVPAQSVYFTSSDTTKIAGATSITSSTAAEVAAGTATMNITVANSATADRYGDVTLTFTPSSSVLTPTTTVVVSLAKVEADSYTLTTDADSYVPGAKVTFTLTRKDATRAPAGSTNGALSWASNFGYTGTMATDVAASLTGVDTWSVYAPSTPGTWVLTGTLVSGNAWSTALDATTFTKSIVIAADGPSATDAVDAATEATDAANAATDAANAAAEAADAATAAAQDAQAAAQDAQAAVAALATQVATLMASMKAQITSLTNLVIKIQKKVKA